MSLASKIVLGLSSIFTISTVTYVHYWQRAESDRISANVRREIELERQAKLSASSSETLTSPSTTDRFAFQTYYYNILF